MSIKEVSYNDETIFGLKEEEEELKVKTIEEDLRAMVRRAEEIKAKREREKQITEERYRGDAIF